MQHVFMKPLVYWCRWHNAKLKLHGRSQTAVWGELAFPETADKFHFHLQDWVLTIGEEPNQRVLKLDEMGVELKEL